MKVRYLTILLVLTSCHTPTPITPAPVPFSLSEPLRMNLDPERPIFSAASLGDPTLVGRWNYGVLQVTNYLWDLQGSSNLITWVTEQTNLGPGDVFVRMTNKFRLYRMKGRTQ